MIAYFGYGAMKDADVMEAVIGRRPSGEPAVVRGMGLSIQTMAEIPLVVQEVLRRKWPDSFRSYSLMPRAGATVSGMLWSLTKEEREIVCDWELVYLVWYEIAEVNAYRADGGIVPASTEIMSGTQASAPVEDGIGYPALLNPKEDVLRIALEARGERPAR